MKRSTLPIVALTLSAASVGCAWTVNIALYRLWLLVPADVFPAYQAAHEVYFVPLAALLGIPNLFVAILLARRGLPTIPRWLLWVGASLALVPWVATPAYFIPLQSRLALSGPTPELVAQLVTADIALRAMPVTLQLGIVLWALVSTSYRHTAGVRSPLEPESNPALVSRSGGVRQAMLPSAERIRSAQSVQCLRLGTANLALSLARSPAIPLGGWLLDPTGVPSACSAPWLTGCVARAPGVCYGNRAARVLPGCRCRACNDHPPRAAAGDRRRAPTDAGAPAGPRPALPRGGRGPACPT